MTYVQFNFMVFLLITFCVFYICPVKFRWIVLLGASLIFYGIAGVQYLPFIFVTSFSVWLAGKKMGAIYEQGIGSRPNGKRAAVFYKQAADKGHVPSMVRLAQFHEVGRYVVKDLEKAAKLYERAAEEGDPQAMCGLGAMYYYGNGVTKSIRRAVDAGISVVITTQCLYDSSDLRVYQVGNKLLELGVIQGRDMTTEAAMTKLMWAIGQGMSQKEIRKLFAIDLAGEVTTS